MLFFRYSIETVLSLEKKGRIDSIQSKIRKHVNRKINVR